MPPLTQAQLQRIYRPVLLGFCSLVVLVIILTVVVGSASAVITITSKLTPLNTGFSLIVGPATDPATTLPGTITSSLKTASVTAAPSATGAPAPAHATGTVVIHNTTASDQPLAAGTRLQDSSGVIVRTDKRLDVAGHSTASVAVTADPLGETGNLAPGRLTIVALRAGNQALIYGQLETAMTGGTVATSGTLALEALTAASDQAQAAIRKEVGPDQPGHLRLLIPDSVVTDPPATTPSASYRVTVSLKLLEVVYDANQLNGRLRQELTTLLAHDQTLARVDTPTISVGDQPTDASITLNVVAQGQSQLAATSPTLQPKLLVGLNRDGIKRKLLADPGIKAVSIQFSPFWRAAAPDRAERITVTLTGPAAKN